MGTRCTVTPGGTGTGASDRAGSSRLTESLGPRLKSRLEKTHGPLPRPARTYRVPSAFEPLTGIHSRASPHPVSSCRM
jgi:hypothetical protein